MTSDTVKCHLPERYNALASDIFQRASALNIIINAISVWNTVYLDKAIEFRKDKGNLKEELLHHVSPLGWEHINFLGEYKFDSRQH